MADYVELDQTGAADGRTERVVTLLDLLGWIVLVTAIAWGLMTLIEMYRPEAPTTAEAVRQVMPASPSATELATVIATMLAWAAGGIFLWGIAEVIRRMLDLQYVNETVAARSGQPTSVWRPTEDDPTESQATLNEMILLLREVRDISLLTSEQRAMRLQAQGRAMLEVLQREVPTFLREHNWIEARNRVLVARERFPTFGEWDELETQIERMREQVEQHDIEAAERQIRDLTSLGAWDRVDEVLKELLERHPDSIKCITLAQRLRVERNRAESEQRAKLMVQAQDGANNREWDVALEAAAGLIKRFPQSPEAQALRMQLPTLRENAQIKERQRMENEIRELVKAQRFEEGLRIARDLIDQYPTSPQAEVLREQLPRLEQRAAALRR